MTYGDYLTTSEMTRWILDTDIAWDRIDPVLALAQPEILDRVRDSALIESFFPIFTPRALELLWDDPTSTAIFSVQLYESYKHFHVFAQYLDAVGYRPILDEEIIAVRRRQLGLRYDHPARLLTRYLMSEHFAAHNFFKDSRRAAEPVLRHILQLVAKDEVRHCQFACELLAGHLAGHPGHIDDVLDEAAHFKHLGEMVVPQVPVAERNDFAAILAINRKIARLTGRKISRAPFRGAGMNAEAVRNLAWKLNWWRQERVEGALLLGRMVAAAPRMANSWPRLTRHCAEEAEHSRIWAGVIVELGLPHICIARSYQSFLPPARRTARQHPGSALLHPDLRAPGTHALHAGAAPRRDSRGRPPGLRPYDRR